MAELVLAVTVKEACADHPHRLKSHQPRIPFSGLGVAGTRRWSVLVSFVARPATDTQNGNGHYYEKCKVELERNKYESQDDSKEHDGGPQPVGCTGSAHARQIWPDLKTTEAKLHGSQE